jgi:hypothetical protein
MKTSVRIAGCRNQKLNPGPPKYEVGALTTQSRCLVQKCLAQRFKLHLKHWC